MGKYTTEKFMEDVTKLDYDVRLREFGNGIRVLQITKYSDYFDEEIGVAEVVDIESNYIDETINHKSVTEVGMSIESIKEIKLLEIIVKYVKQNMG